MNLRHFVLVLVSLIMTSQAAHAVLISNTDIDASTTLIDRPGLGTSIDQIADGSFADRTSFPYYGFVSASTSGTIRLDFNNGPYDLTNFYLYNDVYVGAQGINEFRLDFYDSTDTLLGDFSGTAVPGQFAVQDYAINALGVSRVDLVVLSSFTQIEIREVQFEASTNTISPVPEPNMWSMFSLGVLLLLGTIARRKSTV